MSSSSIGSITILVTTPSVTRADNCASEVIVSPAAGNTCTVGAAWYPEPPFVTVIAVICPPLTVAVAVAPAPGPYTVVTFSSSNDNISSNLCSVRPFVW